MPEDLPPDELALHALADGCLPPDDSKRLQAMVDSDPSLQRKYRALMAQKQLLLEWWFTADSEKPAAEKPRRGRELETMIVRH